MSIGAALRFTSDRFPTMTATEVRDMFLAIGTLLTAINLAATNSRIDFKGFESLDRISADEEIAQRTRKAFSVVADALMLLGYEPDPSIAREDEESYAEQCLKISEVQRLAGGRSELVAMLQEFYEFKHGIACQSNLIANREEALVALAVERESAPGQIERRT